MKGIYIKTTMSGLAKIVPNKKVGEQPCTVFKFKNGGSVAQVRVNTSGWFFPLKFDPSLIGDDTLALVAGEQVYFEGYLTFSRWQKKNETKESYFQYVQVTRLVYGEEVSSMVLDLKQKALQEEMDALKAKKEALSAK